MNYQTRAITGLFIVALLFCFITVGYAMCPFDPADTRLIEKNTAPSLLHPFGTDELGRDLLARTIQGTSISLAIGALAATIDLIVGTLWGGLAALSGGWVEKLMMRCTELLYSMPYLLFVILASVFFGTGFAPLLVAMVCIGWIQMARVVRVLVKSALCSEYVRSAYALGIRPRRLFFSHIVPNIIGPVLAASILAVPHAIFTEAFLSFLGVGIQSPTASLGSMVSDALPAMRYYPWRLLFPAGFISLLIFGIMLVADSLRDYYDPRQRLRIE